VTQAKPKLPARSDDEVREVILRYLYDRNQNATSRRGKSTGAYVTISVMRAELKATHELSVQEIHSNLTYLESQGWVEDRPLQKSFTTGTGGVIPSITSYYVITAAGIDRIGGPSMFTRDRFEGIRIEATGQNIITLGDGNQVNARFQVLGEALAELRRSIKDSKKIDETQKMELVVDVDTLQAQLARPTPKRELISQLWEGINHAASAAGLIEVAAKVGSLLAPLLS
jgi:putative lipoic acid-binding regulatory protein